MVNVLYVSLACLMPPSLVGQTYVDQREALAGLPGVRVTVQPISTEAKQDGLSEDDLKTDIELLLHQSSITVHDEEDDPLFVLLPELSAQISALKSDKFPMYAVSLNLELNHVVPLYRHGSHVSTTVTLWRRRQIALLGSSKLKEIRDDLRNMVGEFANDFLAANPKQ